MGSGGRVRTTNADCESQKNNTIQAVLRHHEQENKREYNARVMQIEHGTFTAIVVTVKGGIGEEATRYLKAFS